MRKGLNASFKGISLLFITFLLIQSADKSYSQEAFSHEAFSQDLIKTYYPYLPQKYLNESGLREQISVLIESKGCINPDLIYYYITYYNMLAGSATQEEKAECNNFKRYINYIEKDFIIARNQWAKKQIGMLDTMKFEYDIKSRLADKFRQLILKYETDSLPIPSGFKVDENRKNYYSILYINPAFKGKYSSEVDYKSLKEAEESNCRNELLAKYNAEKLTYTGKEEEITEYILSRWYLLDNSGDSSRNTEAVKIAAGLSRVGYFAGRQTRFSIGFGYSPQNEAFSIKPSVHINVFDGKYDFEMKSPMKQIGIMLGYKHYVKDAAGLFSYINFEAQYFSTYASEFEPKKEAPGFTRLYTINEIDYREELAFSKSVITPKSAQNFLFSISTPVYVLLNSITVEAGLLANLNQVKYGFEYSYAYAKYETYVTGSILNPKTVTERTGASVGRDKYEKTEQEVTYSPLINVVFTPIKHAGININLSTKNISIFLLYSI